MNKADMNSDTTAKGTAFKALLDSDLSRLPEPQESQAPETTSDRRRADAVGELLAPSKTEERVHQWVRRFEIIGDLVAMHVIEGRTEQANKGRRIGQRAYDRWVRELSDAMTVRRPLTIVEEPTHS